MPEARPVGNFDPTKTRIGNFAMSGGDGRQLDVNVDGGDNKDNVVGSLIQNFAYESIQEFQVLQHRWTAESGRSVGGVVNVISKSGTNQLRGSAFGSYRGDNTRTMDFFELQRQDADPDVREGRVHCARSSADRSAGRSSATACSSSAPTSGSASARTTSLTQTAFNQLQRRARRAGAVGDSDAVRRHAADGRRSTCSRRRRPDDVRALRVSGPVVAERPDSGAGDRRPEQRQHQHDAELRLRRQPHVDASGRTGSINASFHFQDFTNADPAQRDRRAVPRFPERRHRTQRQHAAGDDHREVPVARRLHAAARHALRSSSAPTTSTRSSAATSTSAPPATPCAGSTIR